MLIQSDSFRGSTLGSLLTFISPSVATVHGKVQFLGGRFRSENLHYQRPSVQGGHLLRALRLLSTYNLEREGLAQQLEGHKKRLEENKSKHTTA